MDIYQKLKVLTDGAKYDAACTSSGIDRGGRAGSLGSASFAGCCHSFSADGRCVTLLKVLMSNDCVFNCAYCVNRRDNDCPRVSFEPEELCELTMQFYRRNYIEGLFLSSAVVKSPDYTTELMIKTLSLLRRERRFDGYIHAKAIPGASKELIDALGLLADRISVNIEMPSSDSLALLAPQKKKEDILGNMAHIRNGIETGAKEIVKYKHAAAFAPAGQSTQMIVGASGESDHRIITLAEGLYKKYRLKRVFFSAYIPVVENPLLPSCDTKPPLVREHRLYQADWLLRYYGFAASEILDEGENLSAYVDPKCGWAIRHFEYFPLEIATAEYEQLLRVPGIGVRSARRIVAARREGPLDFAALKRIGVVLKRARYFITCGGRMLEGLFVPGDERLAHLLSDYLPQVKYEQQSLFSPQELTADDIRKSLTGEI